MNRLSLIDGLRGVAAMGVVFYHFNIRLDLQGFWGQLVDHGALGVSLFFVLSGFVIAMSVGNKLVSGSYLGRFALRRSLRLDPPYIASMIVIILIAVFGAQFGANQRIPTLGAVAAHLFYLQDLLGIPAISPVYWSLCLEIQFYLFLVVGMWALQKGGAPSERVGRWWYQAIVFGTIAVSLACRRSGFATGSFIPMWYCFAVGVMTYWAFAGWIPKRNAVAAIVLVALAGWDSWSWMTALSAGGLLLASQCGGMNWMSNPVAQFFGRISYSLYLTHGIFGWYALSIALMFVNSWIATLVGLVAAISSAWMWYVFIERPSIRLSRRVSARRSTLTGQPLAETSREVV